jgi:hypothetical protein
MWNELGNFHRIAFSNKEFLQHLKYQTKNEVNYHTTSCNIFTFFRV